MLAVFAWLFVLLSGVLGVWNGLRELSGASTRLQQMATAAEFTYGVLGILGGVALHARRGWTGPVLVGWWAALTATGALAPIAWGGAGVLTSVLAGGFTALIATLVLRLARRPAPSNAAGGQAG